MWGCSFLFLSVLYYMQYILVKHFLQKEKAGSAVLSALPESIS